MQEASRSFLKGEGANYDIFVTGMYLYMHSFCVSRYIHIYMYQKCIIIYYFLHFIRYISFFIFFIFIQVH